MLVNAPSSEAPDDPYDVSVYVDFGSAAQSGPFTAGSVIECANVGAAVLSDPITVDFYDE